MKGTPVAFLGLRQQLDNYGTRSIMQRIFSSASLVAGEQTQAVALPRRSSRQPHYQGGGGGRVPKGASNLPDFQTDHTAFASARIRSSSAGIRHRRAHHSTAAWSSQPGYHGPLSAHRRY